MRKIEETYFNEFNGFINGEEKQLYYHAYDESRQAPWANKETGLSQNFCLRAMGWYLISLIDVMDEMSIEIFEQYKYYERLIKGKLEHIEIYQGVGVLMMAYAQFLQLKEEDYVVSH